MSDGLFHEIEYDLNPVVNGVKIVNRPEKIAEAKNDEIRELFARMRSIKRNCSLNYINYNNFFDRRVQRDNGEVFYKQARLMEGFEDNYVKEVSLSLYFPYYQMLNYEQLRTYFTWRTFVRKGEVRKTSLSYVFLYIYELLSNIGVEDPQDGLEKLMFFRDTYNLLDKSAEKYLVRWLKDYFIYYSPEKTFKDFTARYGLNEYYPETLKPESDFDLFCGISKYDIRKSAFFTGDNIDLIRDCFYFCLDKIRQAFEKAGMGFDDVLFRPTKKLIVWKPFRDAVFYPWLKQADRRVVISANEIYICKDNEWKSSTVITTEKGRQFIGFVMKQMEAVLRKLTGYKFKISANVTMVHADTLKVLNKYNLYIEKIVAGAVTEYYREATKTVVAVDSDSLARIREEALETQEALIVEDFNFSGTKQSVSGPEQGVSGMEQGVSGSELGVSGTDQNIFADLLENEDVVRAEAGGDGGEADVWGSFRDVLSECELGALGVLLGKGDVKEFADENGVMVEVLVDGINEKAMDFIGDNLLDEGFEVYEDYLRDVSSLLEG